MTRRTAVVFDLDGTLIDTEETWDEVRRGLAAEQGLPWPAEATPMMMGLSTQEWSGYLHDVVGVGDSPEDAARKTITALQRRYADGLPVLPGAADAIRRMAARGPVGVASSSPRVLIDAALAALGVADLVGAVRSTEEGAGRGKPEPDAFLWVCEQLGVAPADAVAIEDSSKGLQAAHAAGMKIVAIPPRFHPPGPDDLALADVVLDDLGQLTPDLVEFLCG